VNAADKVTAYLHKNVSEMIGAGKPWRDQASGLWHVPAVSNAGGEPVVLAEYVLDPDLRFVENPIEEIMDRFADQLSCLEDADADLETDDMTRGDVALQEAVRGHGTLEETADEVALVDGLTNLGSAAACLIRIGEELARSARYRSRFCVLAADVDGLDRVNDQYGPLMGDALIRQVARDLETVVRSTDFVGRWAGGTFVVIVQGGRREVRVAVERLRQAIDRQEYRPDGTGEPLGITISLGAAPCPGTSDKTPRALIAAARDMLTAAKAAGGNRAMFAD